MAGWTAPRFARRLGGPWLWTTAGAVLAAYGFLVLALESSGGGGILLPPQQPDPGYLLGILLFFLGALLAGLPWLFVWPGADGE